MKTPLYEIIIQNRDYSFFYIINTETKEKVSEFGDCLMNPIQHKMFSNDIFSFVNDSIGGSMNHSTTSDTVGFQGPAMDKPRLCQGPAMDKPRLCQGLAMDKPRLCPVLPENKIKIHSSSVRSKEIPGILILENNKTYGRTPNKKRLFYKCIPHDKSLPAFLVPYEIQLGFQKVFKNKYVTFRFDHWKGQHPHGLLIQTLGSTDDLSVFYEYQLYCRELHSSMIPFIQQAKKQVDLSDKNVTQKILNQYSDKIEDRRSSHTVFSIDPLGATDIDDALSIRENQGSYEISIYIANVYLWMEYYQMWDSFSQRVATIYLPDKRRPLLPTVFSENLCSLLEGHDRFAFTMTLFVDADGVLKKDSIKFSHTLINVSKNENYQQVFENPCYNTLFQLTRKMDLMVTNSQELVAFWMIYMNTVSADILYKRKTGIFRSSTAIAPSFLGLPLWNHYIGNYVLWDHASPPVHASLGLKQYVHITSPIRRLVDIVNQTLLIQCLDKDSDPVIPPFIQKCFSDIDRINKEMKSIRKVQSDCDLVYRCFTDPDVVKKEYKGVICEKNQEMRDDFIHYTIYLEEFSLMARMKCKENLDISSSHQFQLFLFEDEDKIQKKIRLQKIPNQAV